MAERLTFGIDSDREMDRVERRRESWRRSSRKYRTTQKREREQQRLFDEEEVRRAEATDR